MKRSFALVTLLFVVAFASGCMFDSDDKDNVKKGSVSGKITTIVTGEPVRGVKVVLVNTDAKIDSSDYSKNRAAIIDSAFTDASGRYVIDGIAPGDYGVSAIFSDSTAVYKLSLSGDSPSYEFAVDGDSHTVNFIAEKKELPGASGNNFTITITFKNLSFASEDIISYVRVTRRQWVMYVPFWEETEEEFDFSTTSRTETISITHPYGWTCVFYTLDNYFKVEGRKLYFEVGFLLGSTPANSEFEYDYSTKTLKQTK